MSNNKYNIGELIHDGELYDRVNDFDIDLPFYLKWAGQADGPCLELCCGTGRLTLPIHEAGIDITGLDASESMLKKAKAKASAGNCNIPFIRSDMRDFQLSKSFKLIFIPFNSLQCLYTVDDVEKVFARVREHLSSDGVFILDIFNPSLEKMLETKDWEAVTQVKMDDGEMLIIDEKRAYDAAAQINRVKWRHRIGGDEKIEALDMRCYFPLEMDVLLTYNGFQIVHKFGDYDESVFASGSPKQVYVCELG